MRTVTPIAYLSVAALLVACSDGTAPSESSVVPPPSGAPTSGLQVSPATVTLEPGQTFRLATTYGGNPALMKTPGHVAWQSSDNSVATVTGGLVSALSAGQARITAIWQGYQASAIIRVVGTSKKPEDARPCIKRTIRPGQRLTTQC